MATNKCISSWPQREGLRIGHLNINSAVNKLTDIASVLHNSGNPFHIFGLSEARLSDIVSDNDINIPGYNIIRKDPSLPNATGLLIYINEAITFKRLSHLETNSIEVVWLEIKIKNINPSK